MRKIDLCLLLIVQKLVHDVFIYVILFLVGEVFQFYLLYRKDKRIWKGAKNIA